MKIEQIEKFQLYPRLIKEAWIEDEFVWPSRLPSFLVRVTSESGDYGVGEASSQQWYLGETNDQIAQCLEIYSEILRGEDPRNFANCHRIMEAAYGGGMPSGRTARSGIDMALYDLVGKNLGVPVHTLLGGAYRTQFELLTNLYHKSPEEMATACSHFVDRGFTGLKIKVGDVLLSKGWSRTHLLAELDKLSAALDVTPRHVYVDADANQGWISAAWTVSVLKKFNQFDNLSIEQPLPFDDLDGAVHVRKRSGVPVILDESIWSATRMAQVARMQACDRIVLKLNRLGGFFEAAKVISICDSAGIGVSVDTNPYTLVGDTAVCHIAAISRNHYPVDCEGHQSFLDLGEEAFITGGVSIEGNRGVLPDKPGLGLDINWEALARHQNIGYTQ